MPRTTKARSGALYRRFATPIVASKRSAWIFLIGVGVATLLSMTLFATKSVTVKMLPFDNKSEIAVVVDLPEGASLEDTERTLFAAADVARGLPEVTLGPGLCRHRRRRSTSTAWCGTIICAQRRNWANCRSICAARSDRKRASHDIALDLRQRLKAVSVPDGTSIKVVEVPPGPPVLATLLAEIYGPDAATRRAVTGELQEDLRRSAVHRRHRRFDRRSSGRGCGCRSTRTGSNSSASSSATSTTPSRRCSAACPSAIRTAAKTAIRSRSRSGCRSATSPGPRRWPRRRCPPTRCPAARPSSNWARWCKRPRRGRLAARSSAATAGSPTW